MSIMEIVTVSMGLLAGILGVPVVQWIKKALNVDDKKALLVTVLTSVVMAVGVAFLSGQFTGMEVTLDNLQAAMTMVFSTATIIYKLFYAEPKQSQ